MIKTIIFDIGGVLQGESWDYAASKLEPVKAVSGPDFRSAVQKDRVHHLNLYETGKISDEEFYRFVLNNLGIRKSTISQKSLKDALMNVWTDVNYELVNLSQSLLAKKKLILSNSFPEIEDNPNVRIYSDRFDKVYFSHRIGLKKPEKEVFLHILKNERIKPEETLFIDNKDENVLGAEKVGIKAILYKSNAQLTEALKKYQLIK